MELKQIRDLEEYIQDFDKLWNKAEVNEKQALVIFLGGLELEIKNTMKMFEPKTLKHTYNLTRLQANTLTYRKSPSYVRRSTNACTNPPNHNTTTLPQNTTKNPITPHAIPPKPNPAPWTNSPSNSSYQNHSKPTKFIRSQEFEDQRLKGLCSQCDEKFVSRNRCRNKKVYSLSVVEEEDVVQEEEVA